MDYFQAIVIAIIEGLTEFLPVSSTAHMIFTGALFGIQENDFVQMYQVSIQFGAILAVVVLFWKKFFDFSNINFYFKLGLAVVPALILGFLFDDYIEAVLEKPIPIAITLILGGIVLLLIDNFYQLKSKNNSLIEKEEDLSYSKALVVGFWQCLAMMPGTSRSAASIIGGMQQGFSKKLAAEFSFFLAVPTMLAVTVYSVLLKKWNYQGVEMKGYEMITEADNLILFLIGNFVAFLVAIIAIKSFIGLIQRYGFKIWGWYRIIVGIIFLVWFLTTGASN
jgi:undecaprenyl-diphosphatase